MYRFKDRSERRVSYSADSRQIMKSNSLDFWNLPKYDTNGTVVRHTVEEVWLDGGNEITLDQPRDHFSGGLCPCGIHTQAL